LFTSFSRVVCTDREYDYLRWYCGTGRSGIGQRVERGVEIRRSSGRSSGKRAGATSLRASSRYNAAEKGMFMDQWMRNLSWRKPQEIRVLPPGDGPDAREGVLVHGYLLLPFITMK
jgi:hypothetical protein